MDLIISPRPQTLISTISLPFSSHSRLSGYIRKEFFGCGNSSRLHGSQPRRRCRKVRFPGYSSPQCLSQDFPNPILVVVVAFVAFTALQVNYLDMSRRRREVAEDCFYQVLSSARLCDGLGTSKLLTSEIYVFVNCDQAWQCIISFVRTSLKRPSCEFPFKHKKAP